jgi:hypothetical protein
MLLMPNNKWQCLSNSLELESHKKLSKEVTIFFKEGTESGKSQKGITVQQLFTLMEN